MTNKKHDVEKAMLDLRTALDEAMEACAPFHEALCGEISDLTCAVAQLRDEIRQTACMIAAVILMHAAGGHEDFNRRLAWRLWSLHAPPDVPRAPEED